MITLSFVFNQVDLSLGTPPTIFTEPKTPHFLSQLHLSYLPPRTKLLNLPLPQQMLASCKNEPHYCQFLLCSPKNNHNRLIRRQRPAVTQIVKTQLCGLENLSFRVRIAAFVSGFELHSLPPFY